MGDGLPERHGPDRTGEPVHPTPIYEVARDGLRRAGAVAPARPLRARARCSRSTWCFAGLERFLVEFVRRNEAAVVGLTAAQLVSVAMLAWGVAWLLTTRNRELAPPVAPA